MKNVVFAALLLLGFAGQALAADPTNLELFRKVQNQVNGYAYFTIFDSVSASVDAGYVTLSGKVTMPFKASDIERRVARIDGVTGVRNTIAVLPLSSFDDSLRQGIARAIYGQSSLSMYGVGANPSIHIIVDRGHVTLNGVVNNDMDRQIAGMAARSSLAFEVKNELKTNEEIKQEMEKL